MFAEDLIATDIDEYLRQHEHKTMLRFITCGSVDDGKSTLIGRLLYDSKALLEDQLAAVEADSRKWGTQGSALDFALLVDGLAAEREQGITIDVAYRFFATEKRKFIVADTPGHEQYTRNMVTGASTADAAVILVDASKGLLTQTRRHSYLVSLLGIRNVILAINKIDMTGFDGEVFRSIVRDYDKVASRLSFKSVTAIPVCAIDGDNVTSKSARTPWYEGPTLMHCLETMELDDTSRQDSPFRMPVQWVNRPNKDFRGFCGTIAAGVVRPGDSIEVLPARVATRVARVLTAAGEQPLAMAGQAVTITTTEEVDASRGCVLAAADSGAGISSRLEASLVWMDQQPMEVGRPYLLKIGVTKAIAKVSAPRHRINPNTLDAVPAATLELNEIGSCVVSLDRTLSFQPYGTNRELGGFILIDRLTDRTVAAGMVVAAANEVTALRGSGAVWFVGRSPRAFVWREALVSLLVESGRAVCRFDPDALSSADTAADHAAEVLRGLEHVEVATLIGPMVLSVSSDAAARQLFPGAIFVDDEVMSRTTPGEAFAELVARTSDKQRER